MAMISAHAAWHMGLWEDMAVYVDTVDPPDGPPGSQVLCCVASCVCAIV